MIPRKSMRKLVLSARDYCTATGDGLPQDGCKQQVTVTGSIVTIQVGITMVYMTIIPGILVLLQYSIISIRLIHYA